MPEHWSELKLGRFLTRSKEFVNAHEGGIYPAVGVYRDGGGLFEKDAFVGGETTYQKLFVVHENDLVLRTITAWEAPIAVAEAEHDGFHVSPVFPVFEIDNETVDPSYMRLVCQFPSFWEDMRVRCTGTVLRRKTLSPKSLLSIPLLVPPLEEQRRIVDLVGSIDACIDALGAQIAATRTARSAVLSELLSSPGEIWTSATLADMTAHTIGGVWGVDAGESEVDVPVYRQTEFDSSGKLLCPAGVTRSVTLRQLSSRALQRGDVLIQKSAGTPTLPGRVVIVPSLSKASTFSNFLSVLRADRSIVDCGFYFLVLQWLHQSGVAFAFQRGTNIRNLDLKAYLKTPVMLPPLAEQQRIVDIISSMDDHIDALTSQLEATRQLRAGVLNELLSGKRLLDDTYDEAVGQ